MTPYRIIASMAMVACACGTAGSGPGRSEGKGLAGLVDAPYELATDRDLQDARDRYEALEPGEPNHEGLRHELAAEYARRTQAALDEPDRGRPAHEWLLELMNLWSPAELADPVAMARELAPYAAVARAVRDRHARGGGDIETTAALLFLSLAEPERRADYLAEIEEIFAFADELGHADNGAGAEGGRPIEILEAIIDIAPVPVAVDRLITLYLARQKDLSVRFMGDKGPTLELVRAHGDGVFQTVWHVVRVLARAGRIDEAPAVAASVQGLGANDSLRDALRDALAPGANARTWADLVEVFASLAPERDDSDEATARQRAVLALCREGVRRHGRDAEIAQRGAEAARTLDLLHVSIRLYEEALRRAPDSRDAAEALAELYRVRVSTLAFYERPRAARERLTELEAFLDRAARRWPKQPLSSDLAEAYAAMGRGLTGLGELDAARSYLERSLALRPTLGALEQLGSIAFKQDRFADAVSYFERALKLPAREPIEQYNRAKILRLAGDALHGARRTREAMARWSEAIDAWMSIGERLELPDGYKGELLVESGRAQWSLGDRDMAMLAFDTAVDVDTDGADTHSAVISFLIVRGEYERALDTYHRALGNANIDEYSKVYMSLWTLAEARRSGLVPDPLALEYLGTRIGRLWHHALARYAAGKLGRAELERRATTRGHRAELLYYAAVLGDVGQGRDVRAMLQRVIETDMVMFYEYEMARYWLSEGFAPASQASR